MKKLNMSLIPKTGEKMMNLKFAIFAAAFALTLLSLSMRSLAIAVEYNKDDPKMQEAVDQGGVTEATTGTSADCPSGKCPKYFAPGFQNDGAAIEPADTEVPANPATSTKTKK